MGGIQPTTIFTDQDLAMANAIEKVCLSSSKHYEGVFQFTYYEDK